MPPPAIATRGPCSLVVIVLRVVIFRRRARRAAREPRRRRRPATSVRTRHRLSRVLLVLDRRRHAWTAAGRGRPACGARAPAPAGPWRLRSTAPTPPRLLPDRARR